MLSFFEDKVMMIKSGLRRDDAVQGEGGKRSFKICVLKSDG